MWHTTGINDEIETIYDKTETRHIKISVHVCIPTWSMIKMIDMTHKNVCIHSNLINDQNDQQVFIISYGETTSRSSWAPFVVEARIDPSPFPPVAQHFYQLRYPSCQLLCDKLSIHDWSIKAVRKHFALRACIHCVNICTLLKNVHLLIHLYIHCLGNTNTHFKNMFIGSLIYSLSVLCAKMEVTQIQFSSLCPWRRRGANNHSPNASRI
jgi:hypothetical protein